MSLLDQLAVLPEHPLEAVNEALLRAGLGDGLPLVPPTEERVAAMVGSRDAAHSVGSLLPARQAATVRRVAQCAVMAGCAPPHLPLLLAAVTALSDPALNLLGVATTTGNAALGMLVHGPAAATCGVNGAGNALGPGVAANAVLGRALALVLRNVAGAVPGRTDMATHGQPAKYTLCFAENEGASPWPPLHTTRGFDAAQSAVTVFPTAGVLEVVDAASTTGAGVLHTCAESMIVPGLLGGEAMPGGGQPLLLLAPEHATLIAATHDRAAAQAALHAQARLPLRRLAPDVRAHLLQTLGQTPGQGASAGSAAPDALPVAERPEEILLAVMGGVGRKSTYLPGWNGARAVTRPVHAD